MNSEWKGTKLDRYMKPVCRSCKRSTRLSEADIRMMGVYNVKTKRWHIEPDQGSIFGNEGFVACGKDARGQNWAWPL